MPIGKEYICSDVAYRNLVFQLNSDSSYYLINQVHGGLSFATDGHWKRLDKRRFILFNSKGIKRDSVRSSAQGQIIDIKNSFKSYQYIFPIIWNDTLVYDPGFKKAELIRYMFNEK
ncbi:MAG: hypothetical protein EOO61_10545 [Hymenobacter sp.]|nr:MAG: hypothetical protein EOO61_10545 [Hymenobacter sp.]